MGEWKQFKLSAHELMELHAEALFTQDRNGKLLKVNEPWPCEEHAPRFFMGRTFEGTTICRFRHDVPETIITQMEDLCADEPLVRDARSKPKHFDVYRRLLEGDRFTMGPCYFIPADLEPSAEVVSITREKNTQYLHGGFEWLLSELEYAQPCIALVSEGQAVSVCRSVRITSKAHEAGLETLESYRGRGFAAAVVAGWARAVRDLEAIPLYSTSHDNLASQNVAGKLALSCYGVNFTIR